jgi:cell division protein FtsN
MLAENDRLDSPKPKSTKPLIAKPRKGSKKITLARIAPDGLGEEEDLNDDSWSVQVGAFNRFAPAHLAAGRAARLVPALRGARVVIESSAASKERVYLSRLSGLSKKRANNACNALKKKKMSCRVMRDDSNIAQGDR